MGRKAAQGSILFILGLVLFVIAPQVDSTPRLPHEQDSVVLLTPQQITALNPSPPIPLSLTKAGEDVLKNVGAPEDVQVIYTSDPEFNCGYRFMEKAYGEGDGPESDPKTWVAGCYQHQYENLIFVYWGEDTKYEYREFLLLHEYGHYLQRQDSSLAYLHYTQGSSDVVEQDADCRAVALGAKATGISCNIPGWTWGWLEKQL